MDRGQVAAVGLANQPGRRRCCGTGGPAPRWAGRSSGRTPVRHRSSRSCARAPEREYFRDRCALPPSTYFSALRIRWLFDHVKGIRQRAEDGEVLFGTMESWLIWNLTGGADGGLHITDATNASRTMLMNIRTLTWDDELLAFFGVPRSMLPEIRSSAEPYGEAARYCRASPSRPPSATSRPRCSARPASRRARPSATTERAASCCSTPVVTSYGPGTVS
ncbi:hypothetical protein LT493_42100 [Streptomyces tricolor]|nr:hypothetical protein [Streptomyces tricolor]